MMGQQAVKCGSEVDGNCMGDDEDVQLPKSTLVCISCPDLHNAQSTTLRLLAICAQVLAEDDMAH